MSTNLKPIAHKHERIDLNGVSESIIKMPESREDSIVITMGGRKEFATTLSVEEFENQTGHYIVGLEPEYEYDLNELISQYKEMLVENDFTLEDNDDSDYSLAGGHISFSTDKNVNVSVISYIAERENSFIVRVRRDAGWGTKRDKAFEGPKGSLPLLLSNAERTIEAFTSTKLQILSKELTEEENIRKYDENGFAVLKPNESIEDYFKSQEMNAGIAINAKGKFQAFYSYMINSDDHDIQRKDPDFKQGDHKFHNFHYNTKDYKTLKGAEKFLLQQGYDKEGRALDNVDKEKFAEAFRTYNRHTGFVDSHYEDEISNFKTPNGFGNIEHIAKDYDEKFGYRYTLSFNYTDEETGKKFRHTVNLANSGEELDLGRATARMYDFIRDITKNVYDKESNVEFMDDNRTAKEKADYHKERFLYHKTKLAWFEERAEKGETIYDSWKVKMDEHKNAMDHHKSSFQEFSKRQESENEMGM